MLLAPRSANVRPGMQTCGTSRVCRQSEFSYGDIQRMQLQQLQAQLAELDRRIREAHRRERQAALVQVRQIVTDHALTAREVFGPGHCDRAKRFTIDAKYRDPATGATWSGRGRTPAWIAGRDRAAFLIRE
ncbi:MULTISPECIES: H-NS family nucleoid-associated regulatory protein [Burkholderia cepacia complex]|uniref:H-NS histone family protein n=1 Tax=Burkholderia cepacia complex TaxID=87882 RepID=UPI001FC8AAAE|nr:MULTISPECIES: H-NS histone family protein [Burkholderia cepacia complex]MDN7577923.1 H-NS histone family protein [Burkholderia orbicola]MDN7579664.1 H-NS histone family protein [Burkholderia orbicola]